MWPSAFELPFGLEGSEAIGEGLPDGRAEATLAGAASRPRVRAIATTQRRAASVIYNVVEAVVAISAGLVAQRRTGRALGSNAVFADGTQTLLCAYLSAVLVVGLLLNATLGWYWADPVAGLVIAAVALREGLEAWRGEGCCAPNTTALAEDDSQGCGCGDAGCACAGQVVYRPTAAPSP